MTRDPVGGFADLVGLEFEELEAGYSHGRLSVREDLRNPTGILHGAVLYAMADSGMGAALFPALEPDERPATIEVKINYLGAVRTGEVTCETILEHRGRSTAYLESTLEHDGDTVARATGTFAILST